jgi:hypothetical protein
MLHLLSKPAAPAVGPASSPVSGTRHASTPALISEQEVVLSTAAAALLTPATTIDCSNQPHPLWAARAATALSAA